MTERRNTSDFTSHISNNLIHIYNLPSDFKVTIAENISKQIFDKISFSREMTAKKLYEKCKSIEHKKLRSVIKDIRRWKNGERIPVDCLMYLCDMSKININRIEKYIKEVHYGFSQNPWKPRFPINIDKDMVHVSEAIRVEGHIIPRFQGICISNVDTLLLNRIRTALINLGIDSKSFSNIVHCYIWLKKDGRVRKITNENGKNIKNFTTRSFKDKNERILTFVDSMKSFYEKKIFKIELSNKKIELRLKVLHNGRIKLVPSDSYKTTSYIQFTAYNSVFARFLHNCFSIQMGKKSYIISMPDFLKNCKDDLLKEIIGMVVSCEGNVGKYNSNRLIGIKMASGEYLNDMKEILSKLGIPCKIEKAEKKLYRLLITRKRNLVLFSEKIPLYHSEKIISLKQALNSYSNKKLPHWEAERFYLENVGKVKQTTSEELAKRTNKNSDYIRNQLKILMERGYLKRIGGKCYGYYRKRDPYIYSLTDKGKQHLSNR